MPKTKKQKNRRNSAFGIWHSAFREGFTMIEIVVMLGIVTAVSAVVLFSFGGLNEGAALNRSAREVALSVRRAQNMAIAVSQIPVGVPDSVTQVPLAIGMRFATDAPTQHFLFADLSPVDFRYGGDSEKIPGSEALLERGVNLNRLLGESGQTYAVVHIIFVAPEANILITDSEGNTIPGEIITLEFSSVTGQLKKTVVVRTSGQVSIK